MTKKELIFKDACDSIQNDIITLLNGQPSGQIDEVCEAVLMGFETLVDVLKGEKEEEVETMTVEELLEYLDGRGMVYEDMDLTEESLEEIGLTFKSVIKVERGE
jgi:hypothetical protein